MDLLNRRQSVVMEISTHGEASRSCMPRFVVGDTDVDDAEHDSEALNTEAGDMDLEHGEDYSESVGSWADDDTDSDVDEDNERSISRHMGFLFTLLSPSVDIITVWRFPYIAYKHGGIIMLPFVILYFLVGLPVSHLELTLGQLFGGHVGGNSALGYMVPFLRGVCYSSTVVLALYCIYHMTVISWCLFYFFTSMQDTLPWAQCPTNTTKNCFVAMETSVPCRNESDCQISLKELFYDNYTFKASSYRSSSEHYFHDVMLNSGEGLFHFGPLIWKLSLCLVCAWFFVYMDVRKGKISFRKTSILPSIAMMVIICATMGKSTTEMGFQAGVRLYFTYNWAKLKDFRMWLDAATQVILSSGIGTGLLQVMGRRSHVLSSLRQDAFAMAVVNVIVSFVTGLAAFCCLGFLRAKLGTPDFSFLKEELSTSFVVFSACLVEFPAAIVVAILFFLILVIVSLKRQRLIVYAVATAALEAVHNSKAKRHRSLFITTVCILLLGLGIILTFNIGIRLLLILDLFVFGWPVLVIVLVECLAVMLLYDRRKFFSEIDQLLQVSLGGLWTILWTVITPALSLVVILFGIVLDSKVYFLDIDYTSKARLIGWTLVTLILSLGPIYAIYKFIIMRRNDAVLNKAETESVLQAERRPSSQMFNEEKAKPHWHALAQRRKGSITPLPKILVVKMDEGSHHFQSQKNSSSPIIPYGFVLTPGKKENKTPKSPASKILAPQLSDLLSPTAAPNFVSTIAMPSPLPNNRNCPGNGSSSTPTRCKRPQTSPISPAGEMIFSYKDVGCSRSRPRPGGQLLSPSFLKEHDEMRPRANSDGGAAERRKMKSELSLVPVQQRTISSLRGETRPSINMADLTSS